MKFITELFRLFSERCSFYKKAAVFLRKVLPFSGTWISSFSIMGQNVSLQNKQQRLQPFLQPFVKVLKMGCQR